jgi:acetyl esterase/lipase
LSLKSNHVFRAGPLTIDPNHLAIDSGQEGITGLWIPPVPNALITGKLKTWSDDASVSSIRIPGYWTFQKPFKGEKKRERDSSEYRFSPTSPALPDEKVIYFLHGGAYVMMSACSSHMEPLISDLLHSLPTIQRELALEYRLSAAKPFVPAAPFPAALVDALAGYVYLVDTLGFEPKNILIVGDSAGGNLALALVRYLIEHRSSNLLAQENRSQSLPPPPGQMLLLSPWCDLTASNDPPITPGKPRSYSDYLTPHESRFSRYARAAFLGPVQLRARGAELNPYISPASRHQDEVRFVGFPRTMIVAGEAERLRGQIETLVERMVKDLGREGEEGGSVTYYVAAGAPHDFLVFPFLQPEGRDTLRAIAEWFSKKVDAKT